MTEYPMASLTADLVIFAWFPNDLKILLIKRGAEPYKDHWALPGGFVNASNGEEGERAIEAGVRELKEETGLEISERALMFTGYYDAPGRDPRGKVVSFAYAGFVYSGAGVKAGDDAADYMWATAGQLHSIDIAFDHLTIINDAMRQV